MPLDETRRDDDELASTDGESKPTRRPRRDTGFVSDGIDAVNKDETTHTYEVEDATRSMCHLRTVDEDAEGEERSPTETEDDAYADDEHEAEDADDATSTATLPTLLPSPTTAMNAVKAATETSWRGDGRVARWLAERERKANKRALGPLRRARKELEWIVKRRSAQIANYRRDRKIEIEEQREAMAQAKVASYGVAAKDRKDATSKSETNATPIDDAEAIIERSKAISRLPPRVSVPDTKFNCRSSAGGRRTTRGGRKKKTSAALPWVTVPSTGAGAKNETSDDSRRFVNQRSVWVAPGVFVQMRTDDTKVPRDAARRNAEVFGGAPYDAGEEEARKQRRRSDVPQFFK